MGPQPLSSGLTPTTYRAQGPQARRPYTLCPTDLAAGAKSPLKNARNLAIFSICRGTPTDHQKTPLNVTFAEGNTPSGWPPPDYILFKSRWLGPSRVTLDYNSQRKEGRVADSFLFNFLGPQPKKKIKHHLHLTLRAREVLGFNFIQGGSGAKPPIYYVGPWGPT